MTKLEFLLALSGRLSDLPEADVRERLNFYSEMIEDRVEEGFTEEAAVLAVGTVEEIAAQILSEIAPEKSTKPKGRLKTWRIVLLILGSPLWLPLLIAAAAVILSVYISLWSVVISLWAVFASLVGCSFGGIVAAAALAITGNGFSGIAMVAATLVCMGLSIFAFYGCKAITKGILLLTKMLWKKCFARKVVA